MTDKPSFDSTISEAFRNLRSGQLMEAVDGDILAHLKKKYDEYNAAYFDGELPTIPITLSNLKTTGGFVGFVSLGQKGGKRTLKPDSMFMKISTKYKRDANDLELILLHEMIHVYIAAVLHNVDEHHGVTFSKCLKSLREKTGRDIPLTDNLGGELADKRVKPVGVIVRIYGGDTDYILMSPKMIREKLPEITAYFGKASHQIIKVMLVSTELMTVKAAKNPIQRNFDYKATWRRADPEMISDLNAHGQILWENGGTDKLAEYKAKDKLGESEEPKTLRVMWSPDRGDFRDMLSAKGDLRVAAIKEEGGWKVAIWSSRTMTPYRFFANAGVDLSGGHFTGRITKDKPASNMAVHKVSGGWLALPANMVEHLSDPAFAFLGAAE